MKTSLIFLGTCLLLVPLSSMAQMEDADPFFRMTFNKEKRAIIEKFMQLSESEASKFWSIYNPYETERQRLGTSWLRLIEDYSERYENISDDQAKAMMEQSFSLRQDILKLERKYFKKMSKALSPRIATQWIQLEEFMITSLRLEVMEDVPFVGEDGN